MLKIYITVQDENLDFQSMATVENFELAEQKLDQLKRNYNRRVQMELDTADVHGEASKEDTF